jgi:hypothetical protein
MRSASIERASPRRYSQSLALLIAASRMATTTLALVDPILYYLELPGFHAERWVRRCDRCRLSRGVEQP